MTSTTVSTVDGVAVIADEPVETPLSKPGRPVYFTRIRRLLLADDRTVYGCTECDFTADSDSAVRGHLGWKHPQRRRAKGTPPPCLVAAPGHHARRVARCAPQGGGVDGDR